MRGRIRSEIRQIENVHTDKRRLTKPKLKLFRWSNGWGLDVMTETQFPVSAIA